MKTIEGINHYKASEKKTILTLGTFDGVHIGHRSIIEKVVSEGQKKNLESIVLTFFPHPRMVLQQDDTLRLLNTIEEKGELLEKLGLDTLIVHPFSQEFSRLTAEEFVKNILVEKLNIAKIIIGYDHRFGRNRTATIDDLITFGKEYNFEVEQIPAEVIDNNSVSSTKIRKALENGEIELANSYLGYPYFINGTVIKGQQLGRKINFPTANIEIKEKYKLIPNLGVYVVQCSIEKETYNGMMSIGFNPTVNENKKLSLEVNLFDFNKDIYNKEIRVCFLKRIRDEEKFDSIELLQTQLEKDKIYSLNYFSKEE
ncbi:bifunctional riboflavin kinase/FAD synthetase [Flavobacterium sp. NRK F10]|uniref:bifunctional riboflavin kinase/FAD synthetase n=1 Tax=Flavobacterium sp. NRK F10 TaxID=2954931 RepID=UPI0020903B92|nr:bifunctional riboflavin kinase/FAD synthetase [Flavobacterium sp. NRK F10]MCO6174568.1 bifunctional riboflavin kinase/FAD synthetase [Flavobacterium sp. NRK F10]